VVECDLAKVEVAGSNPVSRSRFKQAEPVPARAFDFPFMLIEARFSPLVFGPGRLLPRITLI
jgi:hypothetical protein